MKTADEYPNCKATHEESKMKNKSTHPGTVSKMPWHHLQDTDCTIPQDHEVAQQLLSPSPSPKCISPISDQQVIPPEIEDLPKIEDDQYLRVDGGLNTVLDDAVFPPNAAELPTRIPLPDIPEEPNNIVKKTPVMEGDKHLHKLTSEEIKELMLHPKSLPTSIPQESVRDLAMSTRLIDTGFESTKRSSSPSKRHRSDQDSTESNNLDLLHRPSQQRARTSSSPIMSPHELQWSSASRKTSPLRNSEKSTPETTARKGHSESHNTSFDSRPRSTSDVKDAKLVIPFLPSSLPTYLQLELASTRPSPLYIYRPASCDHPYESSKVKFERLINFLLLPPQLEQALCFGSLACLDAWLSTFTILPLRFFKAGSILVGWWLESVIKEVRYISGFIYHGSGRIWYRSIGRGRRTSTDSSSVSRSSSRSKRPRLSMNANRVSDSGSVSHRTLDGATERLKRDSEHKSRPAWGRKHRRTKSVPSKLTSYHKADLLYGLLIITSSAILMRFDASRIYHIIRGQNAMKLYVLYNLLEVVDKLLAALGQDILECLTSNETTSRGADGRSRIIRPFGMFILALVYNVLHTIVLFYHVITLNVAVNAYSNALLALLMSNQFVEIKSAVFKKFEKENLFQMSCADVVERFQLWLMLLIIGLRNIVEVGGLSVAAVPMKTAEVLQNSTTPTGANFILPNSFTMLPIWTGEILSPFLIVLGSEMLVDWIKHAYISKFNGIKPAVYQKYLDVLAKDYYTNAFVNQNLIKRLGLPVMPLSCLFIRATIQTYHMFIATHLPTPMIPNTTALSVDSTLESTVPVASTTTILKQFDHIIRMALDRSTHGAVVNGAAQAWYQRSTDELVYATTFILFFLMLYIFALISKLVLGMALLRFSRYRYQNMSEREHLDTETKGKRLGGWGVVELDDEKKKWIYEDDLQGFNAMKEKERKGFEKQKGESRGPDFEQVSRYQMAAKRIW